ncbi:adenylate cyclase [Desulfatibacillum alkenivorans DSM 16219]|jgi:adenylate cyclase|uniref:Adenylate cyclase n=1 Tax=Desulfatibacillum alkenivorans DSM 16219 TaxID=1121393 RepID=A0A1M6FWH5_9BACT|nr:CHASE2 domain-containing protein [Desulfatibacillum alkenivorans]SHJ02058.1 adenylate cyclase [Desulfatibacillum alkenivorans DSM 16219]
MTQYLKRFIGVNPLTLTLLTIIIGLAAYSFKPSFMEFMELKTVDLRFQARGKIDPGPEVVLAVIDEKSLEEQGKWIWPRNKLAKMIDRLSDDGAAVIGFDIGFLEEDQNSTTNTVEQIERTLQSRGLSDDEVIAELERMKVLGDHDKTLAQSIKNSKSPIVLGYFFQKTSEGLTNVTREEVMAHIDQTKGSKYSHVKFSGQQALRIKLPDAFMPQSNIPEISNVTQHSGYFNMTPDQDGTFRWLNMVIECEGGYYAPLSLQTLAAYEGADLSLNIEEFGVSSVQLGDKKIPTDESGRFMINYRGGAKSFEHIPVTDIIEGRISAGTFKDKIVLVGATAIGIFDLRVTPFTQHNYPGLEIHANVVDNILRGDYLRRTNLSFFLDVFTIIIVASVLGFAIPRFPVVPGLLTAVALTGGYIGLCLFLFTRGTILNMVYPLSIVVIAYVAMTVYKYLTEEKDKRFIKDAFSTYLAPSVVNQVIKDRESLKLGGEQREITAFFSDVQGFTSISEKLTATSLVELLNIFLSEMTEIILDNEGTVDKYEGDAIIAFFGAPNVMPDHAARAAIACVEMQRKLVELRERFAQEGRPILHMRIGMNTGLAVVGNMGSSKRFDYTMMGDTVNIAARLEGVNKVYGTYTMISESTYEQCKEYVVARELDAVNVVGKAEPVVIYELLGLTGEVDNHMEQMIEHYANGLAAYRRRQWKEAVGHFDKALAFDPGDPPSLTMKKRCIEYFKTPPAKDWNGAYTMTSK